jgi:DNA-binding LytR/AlgR family response regulator
MSGMKAIIVEDELFAAMRLEKLIRETDSQLEVLTRLESVADTVRWLRKNPHPDLIFLDIHLEDGLSFSIFDQTEVRSSIIFTTAYDEYAIKAFKHRSIDYLLKPVSAEDLRMALHKFREWHGKKSLIDMEELRSLMTAPSKNYRKRFSVTIGEKLKSVDIADVAYFCSEGGITFLVCKTGNQYALESSLDNLTAELDPSQFFRINRQFLVSLPSIAQVHIFPKSRLKLDLKPAPAEGIFVSLDRVTEFKKWLDGAI